MVTAFDLIGSNKPLQKHWIRRIAAYIIDFFISVVIAILLFGALSLMAFFVFSLTGASLMPFVFVAGLVQVFYSAILEYTNRRTIGKMLVNLRVETLQYGLDFHETIIRNLSKIQGLLLFLDTMVGMATTGDPRQRFLDRVANTTVISKHEPHRVEEFLLGHLRRSKPPSEKENQK
ncbi:MAG: RDD family protein [Thermoplasmata archaeon]